MLGPTEGSFGVVAVVNVCDQELHFELNEAAKGATALLLCCMADLCAVYRQHAPSCGMIRPCTARARPPACVVLSQASSPPPVSQALLVIYVFLADHTFFVQWRKVLSTQLMLHPISKAGPQLAHIFIKIVFRTVRG